MRSTFLCDFDGTIAPADIGAVLVERFSTGGRERREALLAGWVEGTVGSRELTEAECAAVRVTEAEALAFVRGFGLDPHFGAFARETLARGDRVVVVSDGFDFYIREQLERAGLGDLPRAANQARFEGGRMIPVFPYGGREDGGCGRCGNCKARHVARARAAGDHVVLVGDGLSDRCAAEVADTVLAKGALLEWCRGRGIAARPFEDFAAVAAWARAAEPAAGRAARGG